MNFVITNSCDKGCPYCFAKPFREKEAYNYMTLDQFSALLDKHTQSHVKLLGGEPTQHPNFAEILSILEAKNKDITLISNFLFKKEKLNAILKVLSHGTSMSFLVNSTDLDIKDRIAIFKKNYNTIYNYLYSSNKESKISCGITIYETNSLEYYINYLEFLKKNLSKIERLRISINFPGNPSDKGPEKIINRTDLGEIMLGIITWCLNNFITPSIDCIYFPCFFKNKEELKIIKKFVERSNTICGSSGSPSDLFPNEIISFCYCTKNYIDINFKDYKIDILTRDALNTQYQIIKSLVKLPSSCEQCNFYLDKQCEGPCLGFYDLQSLNIPKWV